MLKKLFKGVKKVAKKVAPFAGLVAGAFGLNPMAAAGLGALIGGLGGGSKGAVAGGLGGYFGGSAFGKDNPLFKFGADKFIQPGALAQAGTNLIGAEGALYDTSIPFKDKGIMDFLPMIAAGTGLAYAGGLFDEEQMPEDAVPKEYKYDPDKDPLKNINKKFEDMYSKYSPIPSSSIYGYLQSIGAMKNGGLVPSYADGGIMAFRDGKETASYPGAVDSGMNLDPAGMGIGLGVAPPNTNQMSPETISMEEVEKFVKELTMLRDNGDLTDEQFKQAMQMLMSQAGKSTGMKSGLGFAMGGDTEGKIMGPGTGRLDNLEGAIVDQNTGESSPIRVSPNEHIIPEYTLFAMGGGDTELGHDMLNKLRRETKPMAKEMGYDFEGAENGTVRYG